MSSTVQPARRDASGLDQIGQGHKSVCSTTPRRRSASPQSIAIVFNTVLAWIKDAYDPLNSFMAALTGHHWITHGLADIAVFVIVGAVLMGRHVSMDGTKLACLVAGAVIVGGGGLALWFVLV